MCDYDIKPSGRGYVTLYINGEFYGNYDNATEAKEEVRSVTKQVEEV